MPRLPTAPYMAFPFRLADDGAVRDERSSHLRGQIEQVLFTNPRERVFRPDFGAGVRDLVFEPNRSSLWEITRKRIAASLSEALQGEVDPSTLEIDVDGIDPETDAIDETLRIHIRYELAAVGRREEHLFTVPAQSGAGV